MSAPFPLVGLDHVALALGPADASDVRRHLAANHIEIEEEADNIGSRGRSLSLYVRDPSGNLIELSFEPSG
jgi:catechol-2,3-dioxygenase